MPSAPLYACAYVCAGATRLRAHIHAHAYRGAEGTIYNNKAEPCSAGAEQRRVLILLQLLFCKTTSTAEWAPKVVILL